jgi:aryl-alcohol dehydrogenase-like predicted oxidoreductase
MDYRTVGRSGLVVSEVGLGCNAFGERRDAQESTAIVRAAFEEGVTFFDTADSYGDGASERIVGEALSTHRDEVVIASKVGWDPRGAFAPSWQPRAARSYILRAVDASLTRLGTSYLDLYQLHMPDGVTPIDETLETLSSLVDAGKVRYVGVCHLRAWELTAAWWKARAASLHTPVSAQTEYSLYNRRAEVDLIPACTELGVSVIPYFPLAAGLLTGQYRRGSAVQPGRRLSAGAGPAWLARADWALIDDLEEFAREKGIDMVTLAIGGLLAERQVATVIAGASRAGQVRANVAAARWRPTAADRAELAAIEERHGTGGLSRYFTPGRF